MAAKIRIFLYSPKTYLPLQRITKFSSIMCATLLKVIRQQPQRMPMINISKNIANTLPPETMGNDVIFGYLADGTPVTEKIITWSKEKADEAFNRGEYATQEDLIKYTDMLIIKSKASSEKSVVGYEPDGTPITEHNYFLSIKEALQQHAQGESHEEVMKEMNDYIHSCKLCKEGII
ncbi:MAG: hypothetical protein LBT49_02455 [Prevotellaceae bacterium]|jgi:hypothetical protein|nr:hypothetical protein [Prevotellaceae bacterium]